MISWVFFVLSVGFTEVGPYENEISCEAARSVILEIKDIDTKISKCVKVKI